MSQLRIPLDVVSIFLLENVIFTLDGLELGQGYSQLQLGEEELELLDGAGFPVLQVIDTLLHEAVLLSQICLTVVILATKKILLLCQGLVFTS